MTYIPPAVPEQMRPQVSKLVGDLDLFARMHKVQDKDSKRPIPFEPLPMQARIFQAVKQGYNRIAVIKARQVAATTGCKMALHHMAYTTEHAAMHAVVSMRADSASALLDDHRSWLTDVPDLLQRPIKTQAKTVIQYDDTKASIKAFTSRSTTGLRSFQPSAVLISEAAYAPDLEETIAQADAAVGEGLLIIESTANTPGDAFSNIVQGAPENGWHVITMWWWEHPAYQDTDDMIHEDFMGTLTEEERQQQAAYSLTPNQLHWYRRKVLSIGIHKFRREYPGCIDDCFLQREGGYVDDATLMQIDRLPFVALGKNHGREIEAPQRYDKYVMGVDVGGGVGGDWHALQVVSVSTRQPVYMERNNSITPAQWAHRVVQVASRYNQALVLVESNNHGHACLLELNNVGYRQQWRNPQTSKPWTTTLQSKLDAFDSLREALQVIKMMDQTTWLEVRSLTIPPGKLAPEAPQGAHDDCAMALALAYRCLRDIPPAWRMQADQSNRNRIDDLLSAARARRIRSKALPF